MKKLILLGLLIAGTLTSFGQSFVLTNDNGPIPNGSGFMVSGDAGNLLDGFAYITNVSAVGVDVHVKKFDVTHVAGSESYFCWGLCYGPSTYLSIDPVNLGAGVTNNVDFSAHYMANGNFGTSRVLYTFFNKNNPNDSVAFYIDWNAGAIGINDPSEKVSFSNAYPNPANKVVSFTYSLPSGKYSDAKVIVKNLLGEVVKSQVLEGSKGKLQLNISDLNTGVYFYSLVLDGSIFSTKKLVVK